MDKKIKLFLFLLFVQFVAEIIIIITTVFIAGILILIFLLITPILGKVIHVQSSGSDNMGVGLGVAFLITGLTVVSALYTTALVSPRVFSLFIRKYYKIELTLQDLSWIGWAFVFAVGISALLQAQVWDKLWPGNTKLIYPLTFILANLIFMCFSYFFISKNIQSKQVSTLSNLS